MTSLVSLTSPSLQILGKTLSCYGHGHGTLSWISGHSFINNSRTSDNIDMKLGPVTKLDKRNKTT